MIKEIIIASLLITYSYAACTSSSTSANGTGGAGANDFAAGKCCYTNQTTDVKAPGVATCAAQPTADANAQAAGAATCTEGYSFGSATCTACTANTHYSAGGTTASCTACANSKCCLSAANGSATVKSTGVATCAAGAAGTVGADTAAATCSANYGFDNTAKTCTVCTTGTHYSAGGTVACTQCANKQCCLSAADGTATVKSAEVATCAAATAGTIGTAVNAATCNATYNLVNGECTRDKCRAAATEAEYQGDGGKKCCYIDASNSRKGNGVATCGTAPSAVGEYNAATCNTGYTLNATTGECIQNICRASQTQDAYRTEGGKQCCYVGSAFILGSNVATCPATGTANTEAAALTCADGYEVIDGACIQKKCRAGQTEAAYQTEGGMKCCWLSATSTLKALGVATCGATPPTAIGEYEALTCSAGYFLSAGTCKALCAATTVQADYSANGQKCCFATTTLNGLKGAGVATCATAPTAVGEYAAATCAAGYFLVSGVCEKICSAATADAAAYATNGGNKCCSKDATNTFKGKGVNTCTAGNFTTTMEWNAVGCDANHYLSAGACMACAADKFSAVNSTTADACQAKDKAPAGTIYDEATQSFLRCTAPCATCVGAPNKCASCVVNVPDFKAPAEADANYETLLKTYQFDNATATCLSSCAEGFKVADLTTRAACVESSTTGVFAIVLSIFSLLITLL